MAGLNLKIETEGLEALQLGFRGIVGTLEDKSFIFDVVESWFFEVESEIFESGGGLSRSGRWKELSSAYEEVKVKKYGTLALLEGTLYATGAMKKSLTGKTADTVIVRNKDEFAIGTSLGRARRHQSGGGNLPQRKVIDPSDAQIERLKKGIRKSLIPYLRKSTLIVTEGSEGIG